MVVIKQNVTYDQNFKLDTDIYFPNDTNSTTKILIFWHGGAWFRGDKKLVKNIGIRLANAGFETFIPNYRLAPQYSYPAAHNDAETFVEWLLNSKYTDSNDLKNIVQIGASVGGTIALFIGGKYGFPTVTWSAPVDFSNWIEQHSTTVASKDPKNELHISNSNLVNQSFYKYFTLTYVGNDYQRLTNIDAKNYDYSNLKQLMMINSADELTEIDTVLSFVKFLAINNHEVELLVIKGTRHAMSYSRDYIDKTLDFIYQTIKRTK